MRNRSAPPLHGSVLRRQLTRSWPNLRWRRSQRVHAPSSHRDQDQPSGCRRTHCEQPPKAIHPRLSVGPRLAATPIPATSPTRSTCGHLQPSAQKAMQATPSQRRSRSQRATLHSWGCDNSSLSCPPSTDHHVSASSKLLLFAHHLRGLHPHKGRSVAKGAADW